MLKQLMSIELYDMCKLFWLNGFVEFCIVFQASQYGCGLDYEVLGIPADVILLCYSCCH